MLGGADDRGLLVLASLEFLAFDDGGIECASVTRVAAVADLDDIC
jgi:hypothetical protein